MILTNDEDLSKKMNSAVFPGLQGGPLMHVIAAKAVAFGEALKPEFKTYAENVVNNAKALAACLRETGLDIVSGGTDNHSMLVDLRPKSATGKRAEAALGRANITCNKNGIPFDPEKPFVTSGVRLGTPLCTICTLVMMAVLVCYFWGVPLLSGRIVWQLFVSYLILLAGTFILYTIDNPEAVRVRRNEVPSAEG